MKSDEDAEIIHFHLHYLYHSECIKESEGRQILINFNQYHMARYSRLVVLIDVSLSILKIALFTGPSLASKSQENLAYQQV